MKLQSKWFELVKSGDKTVEGKLGKRDPGQKITFECEGDTVDVIVDGICLYDSFEDMLTNHLQEALPGHTFEEGMAVYMGIYGKQIEELKLKKEPIVVTAIKIHLANSIKSE
jgi:ASC-1-like (ASCH) protein